MSEPRGETREVTIAISDGTRLAATLYLPHPDRGPQPCLLEALPYRKDDLTASYAESYLRLRDEYGYAVCRVDLRGTGSSSGDATDEYPPTERSDLVEVIAWLAEQDWCTGAVGMWGTSYSGFNALQLACERPPALKAVCAIYASDDRWTDDVHWRGGALKLVDLVDYNHYMTPMCLLPPVPAVWGPDWRAEWLRRLQANEPWVLTWLRENVDGPYWRGGSVRTGAGEPDQDPGYRRIECPVLLVDGWADGYRHNSFRTVEALRAAGVPHRLLAGPWAHADPATAMPGPRIDLVPEMVAWWDRWLRGRSETDHADRVDVFVRSWTPPEPDLDLHAGQWVSDVWPSPATSWRSVELAGPHTLAVEPDVGTAAWIDCAGHLPWGQSGDQREDDARSLVWDDPVADDDHPRTVLGHPVVRLRVSADAAQASLSVKLSEVDAQGRSALVSRGTLDLGFRDGVHGAPRPVVPGEVYDVEVVLDACGYAFTPGHRLRVAVAGSDWPNTVAPPAPVTLTVHGGELSLPLWRPGSQPAPTFTPGALSSSEDPSGTTWTIQRDVLARTTTCTVASAAQYPTPHDGTASEDYHGEVVVDRRTFAQHATAACTFRLGWPGVDVRVVSTMRVDVSGTDYLVSIDAEAYDGAELVTRRTWYEAVPRRGPA
jgi:predicted acyl esterase